MSIPQKLIRTENGSLVNWSQVTQIYKEHGCWPDPVPHIGDVRVQAWRITAEFPGVAFWQHEEMGITPSTIIADGLTEEEANRLIDRLEDWLGGIAFPVGALLGQMREKLAATEPVGERVDTYA